MSDLPRTLEPEVMDDPDEAYEYDTMDHTLPTEAIIDRLRELGASGRMLDLGCGGGQITTGVALAFPQSIVVGTDLAPIMLDMARKRVDDAGLTDRVSLELADVKALPHDDDAFDVVFSNTILHHIPEPIAMLREAWRVLRPGGVLVIRDLFRPPDQATLDALLDTHAPLSVNTPDQRRMLAESLAAALTPDELRAAANEAGMTHVEVIVETDRHMVLISRPHTDPY